MTKATLPLHRNSPVFTGRFQPGNPGKPKGARNKATMMLEAMFDGEAAEIGRTVVAMAKGGRLEAIKLVLDRAYPTRKRRNVHGIELPPMKTMTDASAAMGIIVDAVSRGALAIEDAQDLTGIVEAFRKSHEFADIERRLVALERGAGRAASPQPE
jgi:hypothetical protein